LLYAKKIFRVAANNSSRIIICTGEMDLRRCVDYAMTNNISVKQADIQARIAALQLKQAKLNKMPNLNFSANVGNNLDVLLILQPTSSPQPISFLTNTNYKVARKYIIGAG
jgi:outer membrane protein TolC